MLIQDSTHKTYFYLDRQGNVQKDSNNGFFAPITRKITGLWRNYNLFDVFVALNQKKYETELATAEESYISVKVAQKCGISYDQFFELSCMSSDAIGNYNEFLSSIEGNSKFNANISKLIKKTKGFTLHEFGSSPILQEVQTYSYKTGMKAEMIEAAEKAQNAFELFQSGLEVPQELKLTLKDVRTLDSLAKMKPILDKWKEYQKDHIHSFGHLHVKAIIANHIIDSLVSQAEEEKPLQGAFILYDMDTDYGLRGKRVSAIQRFIFNRLLGTNISHISVGYQNDNDQHMEAHMWGSPVSKYSQSRRNLGNHCFQTFRLDPERLVEGDDQTKMEELFGDKWVNRLLNMYNDIAQEYYDPEKNARLTQLRNPSIRRLVAAIGFRFSPFKSRLTWEQRAEFPRNNEVICSEFAVLSSLQCLAKLNDEIQKQWVARGGIEDASPKLNPPVRENRRLNRVVPHEILQRSMHVDSGIISKQAKCIRAVVVCNDSELMF